ncbi:MAG: hypothetical protein JXR76_26290 [Deltaproteobacteria bacterium]|nr:hypothetical protein [Deltaproteobacteria bacterium]
MPQRKTERSDNPFQKTYTAVDEKSRQAWLKGLRMLKQDLAANAARYINEQRIRQAEIAELSQSRMLG